MQFYFETATLAVFYPAYPESAMSVRCKPWPIQACQALTSICYCSLTDSFVSIFIFTSLRISANVSDVSSKPLAC